MERYDTAVWSNTQYPGIARSNIIGVTKGLGFNEAFMMPENIIQMRMESLTLYGQKNRLKGMRFGYNNGAIIDIGTVGENPTFICMGSSGRIERISVQLRKVRRWKKTFRVAGATVDYSDKDGNRKSASLGKVDGKDPNQVFEIPKGTVLVGAYGTKGTKLDPIGWVIQKSVS